MNRFPKHIQVYLVGGAVRDQLLGIPIQEKDWVVVGARPEDLIERGYQQVGKHFPVFLHPQTHEEYALARIEKKSGHGYQGFSFQFSPHVTLEEDLSRRDLTINAMAMKHNGDIVDPFQGQKDIQQKMLRHVSEAFTEDPLRVLRVARFHARFYMFGFEVAKETLELMKNIVESGELSYLSAERLLQEWMKAFKTQHPEIFLKTLQDCGALKLFLPIISASLFEEFHRLCQRSSQPEFRFCFLMHLLSIDAANQLCEHLKIPKRLDELRNRFTVYLDKLNIQQYSPSDILSLLQRLDAFRRTEDFIQLLECVDAYQQQAQKALWIELVAALKQIRLPKEMQSDKNIDKIHSYFQNQRLAIIAQKVKHL